MFLWNTGVRNEITWSHGRVHCGKADNRTALNWSLSSGLHKIHSSLSPGARRHKRDTSFVKQRSVKLLDQKVWGFSPLLQCDLKLKCNPAVKNGTIWRCLIPKHETCKNVVWRLLSGLAIRLASHSCALSKGKYYWDSAKPGNIPTILTSFAPLLSIVRRTSRNGV